LPSNHEDLSSIHSTTPQKIKIETFKNEVLSQDRNYYLSEYYRMMNYAPRFSSLSLKK
jgi:hypothetical protein